MSALSNAPLPRLPPRHTPFLSKIYVPFTLSSGIRLLLDLRRDVTGQRFFAYSYVILMLFFIALETLSLVTKHWRLRHPIQWWAFRSELSTKICKVSQCMEKVWMAKILRAACWF